jgi:hypothetical protein
MSMTMNKNYYFLVTSWHSIPLDMEMPLCTHSAFSLSACFQPEQPQLFTLPRPFFLHYQAVGLPYSYVAFTHRS